MIDAWAQAQRIHRKLVAYKRQRIVFITRFDGGHVRSVDVDAINEITVRQLVGIYDWRVTEHDLAEAIATTARELELQVKSLSA